MRAKLIKQMKEYFFKLTKKNLPIFGVPDGLKKYVYSKKDIKNLKVKQIPPQKFRLFEEDIYTESER